MGRQIISENFNIYTKKLGIRKPFSSAILLTIKFGPLPMYVKEPKNTAPIDMARNKGSATPATKLVAPGSANVVAVVWNTIAVGALSRNADKKPVQYTNCHGSVMGSGCCRRYINAGIMVAKMPQNTQATSSMGAQE